MGGFFGVAAKSNCTLDLFYGVDYHSHLGLSLIHISFAPRYWEIMTEAPTPPPMAIIMNLSLIHIYAAMKILMIFTQPFEALGATLATYSGQNLGAGKIDRIQNGVKISMIFSVVCSIVLMILINLVCLPMSLLFMKQSDMTCLLYTSRCV